MKLPTKHPKPTILIDTREVLHYTFPGYPVKFASLPVVLAGDRQRAERYTARIIETAYRRHWRQLRTFAAVTEQGEMNQSPLIVHASFYRRAHGLGRSV